MKNTKIISAIAILAISLTMLAGCAADPVAEDIKSYMEKLTELQTTESTLKDSVNAVIGENYTDDATLLAELDVTVPASDELFRDAMEVVPATEELAAVHEQYLAALASLNSGLALISDGVAQGNSDFVTQGNDLLATAQTQGEDFSAALIALAKDHGLEIK